MKIAILIFSLLLCACSENSKREFPLGAEIPLSIGQSAVLQDAELTLRFTEVLEDSRCAAGVQCVWAGQASIMVLASKPGVEPLPLTLTIPAAEEPAIYAGYAISFTALAPYPAAEHDPTAAEYIATLVVVAR